MAFCGYFSDNVGNIIRVNAKLKSQEYIEEVITNEVLKEKYDLFYESVNENGMVSASFDTDKANLIVSNAMKRLRTLSTDFNGNNSFTVSVPASYLFVPNAYFLPDIKISVETGSLLYYDVKLKTDIKEYGINSSLVNLSLAFTSFSKLNFTL